MLATYLVLLMCFGGVQSKVGGMTWSPSVTSSCTFYEAVSHGRTSRRPPNVRSTNESARKRWQRRSRNSARVFHVRCALFLQLDRILNLKALAREPQGIGLRASRRWPESMEQSTSCCPLLHIQRLQNDLKSHLLDFPIY